LRPLRSQSSTLLARLPPSAAALLALAALSVLAALASVAPASADPSSEYHEVARFGGFDESAFDFGAYGEPLTPGKFLEPTGFAVDPQEEGEVNGAPYREAIYVADRTSNAESSPGAWRIQKLSSTGAVLGTTTFTLPGGAGRSSSIVGLAVDHNAGRLYALVMGPVRESDGYYGKATAAQELLAWSTTPVAGGLVAASAGAGEPPLEADPLASTTGQGKVGSVIGSEAQLDPLAGTPLYDPQGIVVDRLETPSVDDPVAIEASDLSRLTPQTVTQKEEGAYEDERNGDTVVQQVATEGGVGDLLARWSSASIATELAKNTGGPRGISDDPDGSISVLLYGGERSAYVVRLSPQLGEPLLLDGGANAAAEEQPIMGIDPGPFFTVEPASPLEETRNAGPELAQLSNGLYAAELALPPPPSRFVPPPYWRSEEAGVNIGVRLLHPTPEGLLSSSHEETIVNTLGDETSPCDIGAEEAALAAGAEGTLWVLDRGPMSGMLAEPPPGLRPGREIIELAPGAGSPEAKCPQPSGTFTMGSICGASQSGEEPLTLPAGSEVTFDAGSVKLPNATKEHQNGTAFSYEWELGDGSSPISGPKASQITHTFTQPGTYTVRLKLSSDFGAYTPPPATVTVTPAGRNLTPHAQFTVTSPPGTQQASFDASGSTPGVCKTVAYYLWNWGDGTPPESDGPQTPTLTHTYASSGNYQVTLTVVNSHYQSAISAPQTVSVNVPEPAPIPTEALPPLAPVVAAPATVTPPPDRSPTHVLAHASFAGGVLSVSLSCPATKVSCAGTLRVETVASFAPSVPGARKSALTKAKATPKRSRLVIGEAPFDLAGGGHAVVAVRPTARGLALLRRLRRLPVLVVAAAHDSFGDPGATTVPLTLSTAGLGSHGALRKRSG
jgi:PKD domain